MKISSLKFNKVFLFLVFGLSLVSLAVSLNIKSKTSKFRFLY